VLIETWTLLRHRIHRRAAERFWEGLRSGVAGIERVASLDDDFAIFRFGPNRRRAFTVLR
jgi:hypothetical protein